MTDGPGENPGSPDSREPHGTPINPQRLVFDGGSPADPGAERHHILRQLRQQLELHPAVVAAWGTPDGEYAAVEASVDPAYFGRAADSGTLRVTWQPTPDVDPDDRRPEPGDPAVAGPRTAFDAMFRVHYIEPGGFDGGFHNEPNPHVDGWFHFQHRTSPDDNYVYEPASLAARNPVAALWELLDRLESILREV